ncbi:oxidoreductase/nitrogenase component 1 [Rhodomicrobium vannielii ATCC 17100]|uniref:Oxidoreductase/nitrogenase component 1 n=1 Tax=Rhodomicrobium vannielii (strain ATCC 17100 / DSM 162 / LMG 4299 / NCIMB 10020 / ATH 3.1.1) TaxID=648757 RepID=E3I4R3_RHOVT|nr:nitrogenase component 1 [Rhodomicrobium vannielii]ADP72735.1 oxidoreductase/nitrogenase component 1 [Rhodomicrobium vannielii ATCC 17100]
MAPRPGLVIREKRLNAIGAWLGASSSILAEFASGDAAQRVRTFSEAAPDDVTAALNFLGGIEGAAIVVHAPRGCAAAALAQKGAAAFAVTGLDQRDTIIGSGEALARTIRSLVERHRPWVVFIVGGPVVAINSDDIRSVAADLTETLGIPVLQVQTDGFRSRIAATGYDAATKPLLPLASAPFAGAREDVINIIALNARAGDGIAMLLEPLGLRGNLLPGGANAASFELAGKALLTVPFDGDAGTTFAESLAEATGVPFLLLPPPIGLSASRAWSEAVAAATGRSAWPATCHPVEADRALDGLRVHIALPQAFAFAAAGLVEELGGAISALTVDHLDKTHLPAARAFAERWPEATLHAAAGQPFELANLLSKTKPDLFIGPPPLAAFASRAGIAAVGAAPYQLIGASGAEWLASKARNALANRAFGARLAGIRSPYASGWYRRSADWHIKQEVR